MDISPEDVGRLLRAAPFAIAVLVALYTRFRKNANKPPGMPPRIPTSGRVPPGAQQPPDPARFSRARPIEPR